MEKVCPDCGKHAQCREEVDTIFGWRTIGGIKYAQSRCRRCKNSYVPLKKREIKLVPLKKRKVPKVRKRPKRRLPLPVVHREPRPEDIYFENGLQNLVARTMLLAADDARRLGMGRKMFADSYIPSEQAKEDLRNWMDSQRFEDWANCVGLNADQFEMQLEELLNG